ncbi:imelysin family protein [Nemorincola caseinilytica]|uniref:Imelysin family protein n=2 Tax=Nemorincola caseinilytica TaxID=2054315 RepID=A0ABP8N322_9BACT
MAAAVAVILSVAGCNKDKDKDNDTSVDFDRAAMLTNYADNYVIPAYADMAGKLTTLRTKIDEFAAAPDTTKLIAARTAWKEAYLTWQGVEVLEFGPEASISLRDFLNIYPVSVTKVNTNITSGSYDLEQFGNKDAQGFPALDYLLNGLATTNSAIVALYTTDAKATGRKQYLQTVAAKMLAKITAVKDAWGGYRGTFIAATSTSVTGSISLMTNAYVLYYERYVRSGKIGLPVGAMTGTAAPELTEAYYTPTLSKDLAIAAMNSVAAFYEGIYYNGSNNGMGFKDYLAAIGTKDDNGTPMANVIATEMEEVRTALTTIPAPITTAVTTNRAEVLKLYDQMQQVVPLLKVDMVSAFGISITYTDNDGD